MAGILWGSDPFVDLVEKATSELLPAGQEDISLNLEICDQVRAKQVQPKHAMQVIKRRLGHKNPNVAMLALGVSGLIPGLSLTCRVHVAMLILCVLLSPRQQCSPTAHRRLHQEWRRPFSGRGGVSGVHGQSRVHLA